MFRSSLFALSYLASAEVVQSDSTALLQTLSRRDIKADEIFDTTLDGLSLLDAPMRDALIQRMTSPKGWSGLVEKFKTLPKSTKLELLQVGTTLPELKGLLSDADVALFESAAHVHQLESSVAEKGEKADDSAKGKSGGAKCKTCECKYKSRAEKIKDMFPGDGNGEAIAASLCEVCENWQTLPPIRSGKPTSKDNCMDEKLKYFEQSQQMMR